eukprot:5745277-Pyramimonas_sp.AAC.1
MADGCGDEQAHTGPAQRPTQTEAVAQAHQGALQQAAGTMAPSGIQTRSCDGGGLGGGLAGGLGGGSGPLGGVDGVPRRGA